MKYKYQLIILGNTEDSIVKEILKQIKFEIDNLKLPEKILNVIDRYNIDSEYVGN